MRSFAGYAFIASLLTGFALSAAAQTSTRAQSAPAASQTATSARAAATPSATGPVEAGSRNQELPVHLLAVGVIILGVWVFLIGSRPQRLSLARAPGRPNRLQLPHFALVFLVCMVPGSLFYFYCQHYLKDPASPPA